MDILKKSMLLPQVPYSGELAVKTFGEADGESIVRVEYAPSGKFRHEILDSSGRAVRMIISDGKTEWVYDRKRGKAWNGKLEDPAGKKRKPGEELDLMTRNYKSRIVKEEPVAGRASWEVEITSVRTGKIVRALWVDQKYGLMLQMKSYGENGELSYWMTFNAIHIPAPLNLEDFKFEAPPGVEVLAARFKPGSMDLERAKETAGIDPHAPDWTPPGYAFESVNVVPYRGVSILHYRYSDGIDVLSLFQMTAKTRFLHHGSPVERPSLKGIRGRLFFDSDHKLLEWRRGNNRFVLVGQLPLSSLRQVAESVP